MRDHNYISGYCLATLLIICSLFASACSDTSKPPFIKAQVIDVYNNKTEIYNAHFNYWWQERGETAFLDTYDAMSRELMVTVEGQQPGSSFAPMHIHLKDIKKIEWKITAAGKKMLVYPRQGGFVETQCQFPQKLQVNPESGLADFSCFITGSKENKSGSFDFKQDLNFLKSITITGIDEKI